MRNRCAEVPRCRPSGLRPACLLAFFAALLAAAFPAQASPPVGTVMTDLGARDGARAVAIQPDGKIVAAGFKYSPSSFALARYLADGRLDASFGNGGIVLTSDFYGDTPEATGVAIQPDGKIVVAGFAGSQLNFALARYNPDGSLDLGFGDGGRVMTNITGNYNYDLAYSLALQADGKIVLGGFSEGDSGFSKGFALVRYDPNGTLDSTFGSGGISLTDINNGSDDRINAILIQSDGKIVAAGRSDQDFAVARYNPDGTLDAQFGTAGRVITDLGGGYNEQARAVALNDRGKILVAGSGGVNIDFAVVRYDANGSLDSKFGTGGIVTTDWGTSSDFVGSMAVQTDGKIVVGGYAPNFSLVRYTSNGSLDGTFGSGGKVTTVIGSLDDFQAKLGLAFQSDGKIIAAGSATTNDSNFALARYNTDGSLDTAFGPRADVAINSLAAGPNPVKAGDNLTYTFNVVNNGPDPAPNVQVGNQFSLSTSLVSCSPSCNLGTLNSGASVAVTVFATPMQVGTLTNIVSASSVNLPDPVPSNDSATVATTVTGTADIALSMTDSPDPAKIGQNLTYFIAVMNNGPDKATLVSVSDTLPAGVSFVSAASSQGSCGGGVVVNCSLGTISPGAGATVNIVVRPTANGTLSNTASVSTSVSDPNSANNSASASTIVNSAADLSISVTENPDPVTVGDNLTYAITVTNNGPDSAPSVAVSDPFPADVYVSSATASQGSCFIRYSGYAPHFSYSVSCSSAMLGVGASLTFTIVAIPESTGTLSNTVSVSSGIPDPLPANNSASTATVVTGSADLLLSVTDTPDPVSNGSHLTYSFTVTNNGPNPAFNVELSDPFPPGTTFVSYTASQGGCYSSFIPFYCNLERINSGASATVSIVLSVSSAETLSSTGSVTDTVSDPDGANNSATATTTVIGTADLSIMMTDSPDPVRAGKRLTYTITVANGGPDVASSVIVTDTLPNAVTWVSSTTSQGSCAISGQTVTCSLGGINSGANAAISIAVTPTAASTLSNTAAVSAGISDPNTANNSATATTTVK